MSPDFGDFVEKEKTVTCDISLFLQPMKLVFHPMWRLMDVNLVFYMLLWELLLMLQDVAKFHLWLYVMGLMSILLNDEKMTEDSLFEILKKTNKEFMN